ncbi:MAG: biotin--[Treponema sp.]|nr:biotin--[acetyl-CoA-carboxylase] ligase [Treponema sp.]
ADKQTKGVGQKGRSWKTTKGSLAFTLVTKSDLPILYSRRTVMACQIALVNVLRKNSGRNFFVRWPNDVWSEEGKVCGVLDELYSSGGICSWQNLGVGINVSSRPSIQKTDSVFKKAEPGIRRKIIGDFITEFELVKKEIASDTENIALHWNSLCMDRKKEFYAKDSGVKMKFIGIDSYGSAIVEKDSVCRTIPFGTFSFEKN